MIQVKAMSVKSCVKCLPWLQKLSKVKSILGRRNILSRASKALLKVIHENVGNVLTGRINIGDKNKKTLKRYKKTLRKFAKSKNLSHIKQRKFIIQKGGFLQSLLIPVVSILTSSLMEKIL